MVVMQAIGIKVLRSAAALAQLLHLDHRAVSPSASRPAMTLNQYSSPASRPSITAESVSP